MIRYTLIRSRRRTLALQITREGKLEARAPLHVPESTIEQFVRSKADWIRKHQDLINVRQPKPKAFTEGEEFLYLGESYPLAFMPMVKPYVELEGKLYLAEKYREKAQRYILAWYRREAEAIILDRVTSYAQEMHLRPGSIKISNALQRWGSCSVQGNINISWRLIMAPLDVVDYVIVHELAHMKQHNHSQAFWKVVESVLPDFKTRRQWLKQNGQFMAL